MSENQSPSKPFFDPTINLGHVLSLSGVIIAIIGGWYSFDSRLSGAEKQLNRLVLVIEASIRQEEQIKALTGSVLRLETQIQSMKGLK